MGWTSEGATSKGVHVRVRTRTHSCCAEWGCKHLARLSAATVRAGLVKLAFNLLDKKLYAIKACKKSQLGCPSRSSAAMRRGGRG